MQVFFSDAVELALFDNSRFPKSKYRLLRERLQQCHLPHDCEFRPAIAAEDEQLLRVHTERYLQQIKTGELTEIEQRRIGFPWSPQLVQRSRCSTGGTVAASLAACQTGRAVHLAGGTHHAFASHGQGYCVFNDVAVAVRELQQQRMIRTATIIDLDVHQGNGTASIFADDNDVFTFSMHGAGNFPHRKVEGDLDVPLPDGTDDRDYLDVLRTILDGEPWGHHDVVSRDAQVGPGLPLSESDIVFYLAGADPFEHDRFGRLRLSKSGLVERDRMVFDACRRSRVPIVVVMAGGYARDVNDIVDIHAATVLSLFESEKLGLA